MSEFASTVEYKEKLKKDNQPLPKFIALLERKTKRIRNYLIKRYFKEYDDFEYDEDIVQEGNDELFLQALRRFHQLHESDLRYREVELKGVYTYDIEV